jgi:GT2 family glycosyltransferase
MSRPPLFSVIVPTHGRPLRLALCLAALAGQTYPHQRFEVIVVDDGSPLALDGVVAQARRTLDIRLLRQAQQGPAAARNAGVTVARGTFLVFTDDDCAPGPGWLAHLATALLANLGAAAGGQFVNAFPGNPYAATSQWVVDYLYRSYNRECTHAGFLASNNLAAPADAFRTLGGFDTAYPYAAGEDRDWCDRWRHAGRRLVYVPDAVVHHLPRLDFGRFWQQHFRYGRGAYRFHRARAQRAGTRMRIAPARLYIGLLSAAWRCPEIGLLPKVRFMMLLALAQAATAAGFALEATRL